MQDYLIALHNRFHVASNDEQEQKEIMNQKEGRLRKHLSKKEKRLLLSLMDEMEIYRLQSQLSSFVAGYKLALGISRELNEIPDFTETMGHYYFASRF